MSSRKKFILASLITILLCITLFYFAYIYSQKQDYENLSFSILTMLLNLFIVVISSIILFNKKSISNLIILSIIFSLFLCFDLLYLLQYQKEVNLLYYTIAFLNLIFTILYAIISYKKLKM
jgi:hypothetical protein